MTDTNKDDHEEKAYRAEVREKYAHESATKSKKSAHGQFGIAVIVLIVISAVIYGIFNYGGITSSNTSSSIILPSIVEQPEEVGEDKVFLDKHVKGINDSSYIPQTTFALTFWNKTDKDIRGFEGIITYSDIFDNEIESLKLSYDQALPAHHVVTIEKAVDYNQFIESRAKLYEIEEKNLKYSWKVTTILYEDGTKETFDL
jgi:hypothetical protein